MAQKHTKQVPANPQAELHQHPAIAQAIATAAMAAAGEGEDSWYKVDEILIQVKPNPGPTTYRVTIVKAPDLHPSKPYSGHGLEVHDDAERSSAGEGGRRRA